MEFKRYNPIGIEEIELVNKLATIKTMLDRNLITVKEFEDKKREILAIV